MAPPSKLFPWSKVRVWREDPNARSIHFLSDRGAIVALGLWKASDPPANVRYVDVVGARELSGPAEVDWSGFPPPFAEPTPG